MDPHLFQLTNGCCSFSSNGLYFSFAHQQKLFIRSVSNNELIQVFESTTVIEVILHFIV